MMAFPLQYVGCAALTCFLQTAPVPLRPPIAQAATPAVASIGERRIGAQDFKELLLAYMKQGDQRRRLDALTPEGRERLLREEIDRTLLALESRRLALDRSAEVQARLERAIDTVLAEVLIEREFERMDLSDDALRAYYTTHATEFAVERRVRARHIVVATPAEAEGVLTALKAGADFETVAASRNIDQTRARGGDLGWVAKGSMVKAFDDALQRLQPGETSGVVATAFGYHVIRVDEVDSGAVRPFEMVKEAVSQRVTAARMAELRSELQERYPVAIDSKVLKSIGK